MSASEVVEQLADEMESDEPELHFNFFRLQHQISDVTKRMVERLHASGLPGPAVSALGTLRAVCDTLFILPLTSAASVHGGDVVLKLRLRIVGEALAEWLSEGNGNVVLKEMHDRQKVQPSEATGLAVRLENPWPIGTFEEDVTKFMNRTKDRMKAQQEKLSSGQEGNVAAGGT